MPTIRVTHVINGLKRGGAESVLARLVTRLDRHAIENRVISLTGHGPIGTELGDTVVPVSVLDFSRSLSSAAQCGRWVKTIRNGAPDIVQSWMYHADEIGGLAARLAGSAPVIWNLRQSNFSGPNEKIDPGIGPGRGKVVSLCSLGDRVWLLCGAGRSQRARL